MNIIKNEVLVVVPWLMSVHANWCQLSLALSLSSPYLLALNSCAQAHILKQVRCKSREGRDIKNAIYQIMSLGLRKENEFCSRLHQWEDVLANVGQSAVNSISSMGWLKWCNNNQTDKRRRRRGSSSSLLSKMWGETNAINVWRQHLRYGPSTADEEDLNTQTRIINASLSLSLFLSLSSDLVEHHIYERVRGVLQSRRAIN